MQAIKAALAVAMFFLVSHLQGSAHAYLDPGTGSIALQVILGTAVAALATVRLYWDRVKKFVRRSPLQSDAPPEQQ